MSKGKLAAAPQLLFVVNNRSDFLSILIQIFFLSKHANFEDIITK